MLDIPEARDISEILEQAKALIEMALEAETLVGVYEPARIASDKLYMMSQGLVDLAPILVREGKMTMDEIRQESDRVTFLISEFLKMRIEFYKEEKGL